MFTELIGTLIAAVIFLCVVSLFGTIVGTLWLFIAAMIVLVVIQALVPRWLLRFVAKALVIEAALPALGLIVFFGGFLSAAITVLVVALASALTYALLDMSGLMRDANQTIARTRIRDPFGARLLRFALQACVLSVALYLASFVDHSVLLLGFEKTLAAGAILALVDELLQR